MGEDEVNDPKFQEPAALLAPSPLLHRQLLTGVGATLAAGGLMVASSVVELSQGQMAGVTPAHVISWLALIPLVLVLRTYLTLAREADSWGLRRSVQCLFGALVLFGLYELISLDVLDLGWQIALWIILGIGILALLGAPFVSPSETPETPQAPVPPATEAPAETTEPVSTTKKAGVFGGLGLCLLALVKLAGKGGILWKLFAFRWLGRLFNNINLGLGAVAVFVLVVLGVIFLIWFAVAKIRLRGKLGGVAAVVGWTEILQLVVFTGMLVWWVASLIGAANQPGMDEKTLEGLVEQMGRDLITAGMVIDLTWALLTSWLFLSVRNRFNPEAEWQREVLT
jgi:hypothetical protein